MSSKRHAIILHLLIFLLAGSLIAQKSGPTKKSGAKRIGKLIWHGDVSRIVKAEPKKSRQSLTRKKAPRDGKLILWMRLLGELEGKS